MQLSIFTDELGVDIERVLAQEGIRARAIPIIKDRYVVHHGNLGGASYVYLDRPERVEEALACLTAYPGIEEVHPRLQAAQLYELMPGRIGDLFALADRDTVFGSFRDARVATEVRSHAPFLQSDNHLAIAHERGLGTNLLDEIDVVGLPVQDVVHKFAPSGR